MRRATLSDLRALLSRSDFYPRSPCGERPVKPPCMQVIFDISIHALLAESDLNSSWISSIRKNFYPRSPCGERLKNSPALLGNTQFLSTLSLRRATICQAPILPCNAFLSTLSLRRATLNQIPPRRFHYHFYPRSPCGERHQPRNVVNAPIGISIHALLAESDRAVMQVLAPRFPFLSTLSLRRATMTRNYIPRMP